MLRSPVSAITASVGVARVGDQEFQHLHAHAFARQRFQAGAGADARLHARLVRRALAEMGVKAKEPQDAQIVFFDPPLRLADKAHAMRRDVVETADIIVHPPIGRDRERVDGKVTALRIRPPVAAEHDAGLAAKGFDVLAQRRDLDRAVIDDGGNCAVLDAGRNCLAAGRFDAADDLLRHRRGRHVDLGDRKPNQRIAHRAADDARFFAVAIKQREQARDVATFKPRDIAQKRRSRHRFDCGTNLPSSICAGT